jgi:hypothetical protein
MKIMLWNPSPEPYALNSVVRVRLGAPGDSRGGYLNGSLGRSA